MNPSSHGPVYLNVDTSEPDTSRTESNANANTDTLSLTNEQDKESYSRKTHSTHTSSSTLISYSVLPHQTSSSEEVRYDDQVTRESSEFEKASLCNILHYVFAIKQIFRLRRQKPEEPLKLEDFNLLGKSEEVSHKIVEFEELYLDFKRKTRRSSLLIPIIRLFCRRLLVIFFWVVVAKSLRLLHTFILRELLAQLQQSDKTTAYLSSLGLFILIIGRTFGNHMSVFFSHRFSSQIKPALIGILFRKISRLNFYSVSRANIGKIVNIASNNINNVNNSMMMNLLSVVFSPVTVTAALGFLWKEFGFYAVPGILLILATWPYQVHLSKVSGKYAGQKNAATDERIKLTNEMIEGIRLLKMYSWEMQFSELIENAREKEMSMIKKMGYAEQFAAHFLAKLAPTVGSFVIFMGYALGGNTLTIEKVYSAIVLMSFFGGDIIPCTGTGLQFLYEARLTSQRIIDILDLEEFDPTLQQTHLNPLEPTNAIEFHEFNAFWGEKNEGHEVHDGMSYENATLKNLSFAVKQGTLCTIVGKIGSGKSTALMSFFKEIPKVSGDLRFRGRIAYVEQEIVIFPGTIRSNILFGRSYDESHYNRVIEACCLLDDFQEFSERDMMEIGERGINLSGGQKARISLARALYSDADIYLLDDPLSAVDTKVAKNLFQNAIRGILKDKTVLLVTHQVHFAKEAEKIVVLEDGRVKAEGALDEIIKKDESILSIFETEHDKKKPTENEEVESEEEKEREEYDMNSPPPKDLYQASVSSNTTTKDDDNELILMEKKLNKALPETQPQAKRAGTGRLVADEADARGRVEWQVYWHYIKNTGSFLTLSILVLCCASVEILNVIYTRSLGYWAQGKWESTSAMMLLSTILLTLIGSLVCREILFIQVTTRASRALHSNAMKRVVRATTEFFDTNPVGRILNRFSNDVGIVDRLLIQIKNDLLDAIFYFGTIFITIWVIVPWMVFPGILLAVFFYFFARVAKKVILESRGIELLARGPIYSVFSTTMSGLIPIRVYNQQQIFINEFVYLLNRHTRVLVAFNDSSRAFGFYCDYLSGVFSCIGIALVISIKDVDPSLVGLTCVYLLAIADYIQWCLRQSILYILMMSSTARLKDYSELHQEADLIQPRDRQLVDYRAWPSRGEVVFNNVHLKYRKDTEHVLKGLTFTVKPGEKIGCVGRTGAGKSSILQALFRMVEIDREAVLDSFITIDGEDILNVGLHTLRENISIIPQAPFTFMGSIRRNLDPLNKYTDEQIIRALEETNLWNYVKTLPKGLDTEISNSSSIFSVGQKQLVCLARALLQNNKILVLDEATANIDFETDNFIQKKILERFEDSTVFTIAHRLSTVANYTKVLVMSHGQAVEFDHPYLLLVKNVGDNSITNTKGAFASMVLHTGAKHSNVIFEIARNSYFAKLQKSL